ERTTDAHLHEMKALRLGGLVEGDAGERLELIRRKGRRNTLLGPDGKALDDDALAPFLGGVSPEGFALGFGLNHETLRQGGKALLEGSGAVGESLFDAGVG